MNGSKQTVGLDGFCETRREAQHAQILGFTGMCCFFTQVAFRAIYIETKEEKNSKKTACKWVAHEESSTLLVNIN